jgi:hypothetical protein
MVLESVVFVDVELAVLPVVALGFASALATLVAELANCDELNAVCDKLSMMIPFLSALPSNL